MIACGLSDLSLRQLIINMQLSLLTTETITQTLPSRHALDFYESPSWFGTELLRHIDIRGTILEPCVGSSAIPSVLALSPHISQIITNDIDPDKSANYHYDATLISAWSRLPLCDWIVTNPPYGDKAAPVVKNAFEHAKTGVAMFLLAGFLECCEDRAEFLKENPPTHLICLPRFCFRKDKLGKRWASDNQAINCFVWDKRVKPGCTKIIVRSASDIPGFYKNPDKAISWEEVEEIVNKIKF